MIVVSASFLFFTNLTKMTSSKSLFGFSNRHHSHYLRLKLKSLIVLFDCLQIHIFVSLCKLHFSILFTKIFWITLLVPLVKSRNTLSIVYPSYTCLKPSKKENEIGLALFALRKPYWWLILTISFSKFQKSTLQSFFQRVYIELELCEASFRIPGFFQELTSNLQNPVSTSSPAIWGILQDCYYDSVRNMWKHLTECQSREVLTTKSVSFLSFRESEPK